MNFVSQDNDKKKTFNEIISYKKTFLRALKKARKQEDQILT